MKYQYLLSIKFFMVMLSTMLNASDKVLIMTYVYNRPDFIELHDKTFKAFLKDDYEYVVFNDAPDYGMQRNIEQTCEKLGIRCFRTPPEMHAGRPFPGQRHIDGIHYSLNQIGFDHDGLVMIIDADMFLIKPFSAIEFSKDYDLMGQEQSRENGTHKVTYMSPLVVFMNMKTLPNKKTISFEGGPVEGLLCDVGGYIYYYLKNNPSVKFKLFPGESTDRLPKNREMLEKLGYDKNAIDFTLSLKRNYGFEFQGGNNFMHYYAGGSNWPGYSAAYLQEKNVLLYNFIDHCIRYYEVNI